MEILKGRMKLEIDFFFVMTGKYLLSHQSLGETKNILKQYGRILTIFFY